jgi:hypothetical protein
MIKTYIVRGLGYHDNKKEFKTIIKKHNLKWSGSPTFGRWSAQFTDIRVQFIRDDEKDITIESRFTIEGQGEAFDEVCKFIEEVMKGEKKGEEDSNWDNIVFDIIYKPNVEYLRLMGMPESMIAREIARYERMKAAMK